ncbi:MAG: hypothetical protein AAF968_16945 [Pseudomonadota bacterium]
MARELSDLGIGHAFAPGQAPGVVHGDGFFEKILFWMQSLDRIELLSLIGILVVVIVISGFMLLRPPPSMHTPVRNTLDDRATRQDKAEIAAAVRRMRQKL